ncbi:hypothetical protein NQ318_000840 [Aromia moschata]|uniref:Uncharacterized protein n=1 Tax=Aromia moschata TaxID=1265417 RepID=A0AAV8XS53_9CUCU|nr:hypothetical protein NQ318_000840 [Aromia moschata]
MVVNPISSTAQVASTCQSTVHRVLTRNKFHPYKLKMVHQLSDIDPDQRLEFYANLVGETLVEKSVGVRCFVENVQFFVSTPKVPVPTPGLMEMLTLKM